MKLEKKYNVKLCSKVVEKNIKNREKIKNKENITIFLTFVNVTLILNLKANLSNLYPVCIWLQTTGDFDVYLV